MRVKICCIASIEEAHIAIDAGAAALGLETEIGDFKSGKAADFVYLRAQEGSVLEA